MKVDEAKRTLELLKTLESPPAGGDARHPGDVGDLRLKEAVLGEHLGRGLQDQVALVVAGGVLFHERQTPGG